MKDASKDSGLSALGNPHIDSAVISQVTSWARFSSVPHVFFIWPKPHSILQCMLEPQTPRTCSLPFQTLGLCLSFVPFCLPSISAFPSLAGPLKAQPGHRDGPCVQLEQQDSLPRRFPQPHALEPTLSLSQTSSRISVAVNIFLIITSPHFLWGLQ